MVSQIILFENGLNLMRNMGYDSRIAGSSPATSAKIGDKMTFDLTGFFLCIRQLLLWISSIIPFEIVWKEQENIKCFVKKMQ